ncbi:MAG: LysM peptidoglycan-binding domain-containing protein [Desulfobacterales bacterium]|nr:LysM peptidoglycan-binding domain-containing protein [Desulfobacterales bacterium]
MRSMTVLRIICFLGIGIAAGWLSPVSARPDEGAEKPLKLESGLHYTIQKGDTLWDISEHFYDSPWVWPDLWEKNQRIPNPHWIYPGERIRLLSREKLETMVQPETEAEPEAAVQPEEPPYYLYPAINSVGFIRKKPVSPSGTIFKVRGDKVMISQRDLVYVRPIGKMTFEPGDRFTVFRTLKPVKDKDTKALIGVQHYILGVVEITEVEPKFSTARVLQSCRHIELNDLLMPYEPRSPKIALAESKEGLKGKIIAAEEHQGIFADTVVFIDNWSKDGVKVGQSYSVYYQEKVRIDPKAKEYIMLPPVDYAEIIILRAEDTTATALITMAEKAVEPGAKIHPPPAEKPEPKTARN